MQRAGPSGTTLTSTSQPPPAPLLPPQYEARHQNGQAATCCSPSPANTQDLCTASRLERSHEVESYSPASM